MFCQLWEVFCPLLWNDITIHCTTASSAQENRVHPLHRNLQVVNFQRCTHFQRKEGEDVIEELKRFTMQEMARGFYLRRHCLLLRHKTQMLNGTQSLQQPLGMQSSASMTREKATTQTSLDPFCKRVDRIESSKEPKPGPSASGMNETAACHPSPIADDHSALPSPTSPSSSSR